MLRYLSIVFLSLIVSGSALAQSTITGKVTDASTGEPIIGANILVMGTTQGAATDLNGEYEIDDVDPGTYNLRVSNIGYVTLMEEITVGEGTLTLDFEMELTSESLTSLEVFASRSDQTTPVAFSDVSQEEIRVQLGSRDLPEVLNVTPSVYSTNSGGGAGDARINVRGFSQRNVAVMINGVPVNDMENGWVYWSNWDGVGDAARSIQVQRGISNVNLAVPSVGGTLNIITDPSNNEAGGMVKFENGSGAFNKTTLMLNSGLINDKFAISAVGVRKEGEGIVDGTWTDSWAYHLAASYQVNDDNRLDLFALGAPQRHGQNLYAQNIATYDRSYALGLDSYDPAAADVFWEKGRLFNSNVSGVSNSYDGNQYVGDGWINPSIQSRYSKNFLNERENFFHKPQVNLNWYSELTDKLTLTNVLYYSGGKGGGTGTLGDIEYDYSHAQRIVDWNATIADNLANLDGSGDAVANGIIRNSRNNQWTIGDILKLTYQASDELELQAGLDWRTAEIEHYREVRDLLGGRYYIDNSNDLDPNRETRLGDKVAYNFDNTVDWLGGYLQGEYSKDKFSTYATVGISTVKYSHLNYFLDDPNKAGLQETERESDNLVGYQAKAGVLYGLNDDLDLYLNVGAISKVPIFDNVINDGTGAINEDPENEKFYFYEAGTRYRDPSGRFGFNLNYYLTDRRDRSFTRGINFQDGTEGLINITGLDQMHTGVELETSAKLAEWARLDVAASHNLWEYKNDVTALYTPDQNNPSVQDTVSLFVEGLKVGNAPQTQFAYTLTVEPMQNLDITLVGTTFMRHWSDFDPLDRDDPSDRAQTWQVPNYTVFNAHLNYALPGVFEGSSLFLNLFNLFDNTYIQDATDNSRFNGYDGDHDADDAEVFFGLPRRYNFGVRINF
ncbi:TonB-dependent receptor [Gracilimonas sediminicola]|uniref:TonB-dependent receptor n=1 Tax=Gracilimonas sediminicola TaxID=2952158 RepID=A0A9X2L2C9_9BACT|nr:TonB-dependent receptor [Gracilimonas sediminicola]MCP9291030.1 TonB-dependent receptor [Gracilimonas sediminicola]